MMEKLYKIKYVDLIDEISCNINDKKWENSQIAEINCIRHESIQPVPEANVKLIRNDRGLNGIFTVHDFTLLAKRKNDLEFVWNDSCVEFFLKAGDVLGYMNFEFNCIGKLYCTHVRNPVRTADGFKDSVRLTLDDCGSVLRCSSLTEPIESEISKEITWHLEFFIPIELLKKYFGELKYQECEEWSCNFYKCGDELSNAHWVSWSEVKKLNFHRPEDFGKLVL